MIEKYNTDETTQKENLGKQVNINGKIPVTVKPLYMGTSLIGHTVQLNLSYMGRYGEYFNQYTVLFLVVGLCCSENRREKSQSHVTKKRTHLYIYNCVVNDKKSINSRIN